MTSENLAAFARRLFDAYAEGDHYMSRLPDLHAAGGRLRITQILPVDDERLLTMVEIRAERGGRGCGWSTLPAYSDEFRA